MLQSRVDHKCDTWITLIPVVAMFYTYLAGTCSALHMLVLDVPLPRMIKLLFPWLAWVLPCWLWFRWLFVCRFLLRFGWGSFLCVWGLRSVLCFLFRRWCFDHSGLSKKSLKNNGLSRICPRRVGRIYRGSCMFLNGFDTALKEYI